MKEISNLTGEEFYRKIDEIYELTKFNAIQYLNYKKWFYEISLPRILNNLGEIFYEEVDNNVVGVCISKKDNERKICTIFVKEEFRNNGIGTNLLNSAFTYLSTTKPVISISKTNIKYFSKIIKKYGWILSHIGHYNEVEFFYNEWRTN